MKEKKYSISEASRILEVENHVLRYWEEELELSIPRNELGHRYYREEEIQLLNCIKELKKKGFGLKAVKEVLPDLESKKLIDVHKLLAMQVELEKENELENEPGSEETYFEKPLESSVRKSEAVEREEEYEEEHHVQAPPARSERRGMSIRNNEEKMREFEAIMGRIVGRALREQAEDLGEALSERVSCRVIREMDDVLEEREEREEARYKKLDEAIRSHQKARQEIAVAKDGGRKKSRFFRKNKRKI